MIKIEPPQGDPLRRWSASGAEIAPGGDGALFGFLAGGKHSVVADPDVDTDLVNDLLAAADAVVWSRGSIVGRVRGVHARRIPPQSSASDRHVDHPVRAGRPVVLICRRPSSRCRRGRVASSGSVADHLIAHRCSSAARSASTSPAHTPARRH